MTRTEEVVEAKLTAAYSHIKPYIKQPTCKEGLELKKLCNCYEHYRGESHKYSECRDKLCFRFWLSYVFLHWDSSYE